MPKRAIMAIFLGLAVLAAAWARIQGKLMGVVKDSQGKPRGEGRRDRRLHQDLRREL